MVPTTSTPSDDLMQQVPTEEQLQAAMKAVLEMCTPDEQIQLLQGLLELP